VTLKTQQQEQKTAGKRTLDHKCEHNLEIVCQMTKNRSNYNATNDFLNAVLGIDLLVYENRYSNASHDRLRPSPYE